MKKRLLVAGMMLFCFVVFTSYAASAQEAAADDDVASVTETLATGSGGLQKAIFLSETAKKGNASTGTWVNAFNKDVTLTGTTAQCIEMRYSGEVEDETSGGSPFRVQFRGLVDGAVAKGGAPYFDAVDDGIYTIAAMNWWVCGLTPGTHRVKIQFKPYYSADTIFVRNRTLIIEYAE